MSPSAAPFDQASGLRELFASLDPAPAAAAPAAAVPAVHALVCPARPALTLPLAQMCSRLLAQRGHRHAWIDELDFDAREHWPLPDKLRFDLGQSLADHVPLAGTLRPLDDGLRWYASARRLSLATRAGADSLAKRLSLSGLSFELALVCADPEQDRPWLLYAQKVRLLLLCPIDAAGLKTTLDWLSRQALAPRGLDLRHAGVMLVGKNSGPQDLRGEARATLQASWQALFGQAPAWTEAADMRPDDALATLVSRWQPLAQSLANRLGSH